MIVAEGPPLLFANAHHANAGHGAIPRQMVLNYMKTKYIGFVEANVRNKHWIHGKCEELLVILDSGMDLKD